MTQEGRPNMERFEFNASPEQAGEALRQLGRIMADIPLDRPPAGQAAPANKIRTYENMMFALYPDGMRYLPDDTSIVYGVVTATAWDGLIVQYTIRQELASDTQLERQVLGRVDNDTNNPAPRFGSIRGGRKTDNNFTQAGLRQEREWGLTQSSYIDAEHFITELAQIPPLESRPTRFN